MECDSCLTRCRGCHCMVPYCTTLTSKYVRHIHRNPGNLNRSRRDTTLATTYNRVDINTGPDKTLHNVPCFSALVRVSDVISSVLSICMPGQIPFPYNIHANKTHSRHFPTISPSQKKKMTRVL